VLALAQASEKVEHHLQIALHRFLAAAESTQAQVVLDAEICKHASALRREPVERLTGQAHATRAGPHDARDRVDQGRLAGAVGADDGHYLAAANGQRDLMQHLDGAVTGDQVGDLQQYLGRHAVASEESAGVSKGSAPR